MGSSQDKGNLQSVGGPLRMFGRLNLERLSVSPVHADWAKTDKTDGSPYCAITLSYRPVVAMVRQERHLKCVGVPKDAFLLLDHFADRSVGKDLPHRDIVFFQDPSCLPAKRRRQRIHFYGITGCRCTRFEGNGFDCRIARDFNTTSGGNDNTCHQEGPNGGDAVTDHGVLRSRRPVREEVGYVLPPLFD